MLSTRAKFLFSLTIATFGILVFFQNCGGEGVPEASFDLASQQQSPNTPGPTTVVNALEVTVSTKYVDETTVHSRCIADGTANAPGIVNCDVEIPEAQLRYSTLIIKAEANYQKCEVVSFFPYYYRRSNAVGYIPPGTTTPIDCSVAQPPEACFSGPATELVDQFPRFTGLYFIPSSAERASEEYEITSAVSNGFSHNRWASNDLIAGSTPIVPEGYVSGSLVNYSFRCRDQFDSDVANINLNIIDKDDGVTGGPNTIPSWR